MELWLFTRAFPQGSGEAFLESALPVWAEQFDRVRVIPMFEGAGSVPLPPMVEQLRLWEDPFQPLSIKRTLARPGPLLRNVLRHEGWGTLGTLPEVISHARQLLQKADIVQERLVPLYEPGKVVLLSTWMEDWVGVLGLVKERVPRMRFATMAHGWDLFGHRRKGGAIPYRRYQMKQVDMVICIAASGRDYLKARFPAHTAKVKLCHLGTRDHGPAPWWPDNLLRLVSCSHLRHPKRFDRIAQALRHVHRPVHWTHLGDGPERPALVESIGQLPAHVRVDLKGDTTNEDVMRWYRTTPADLFLHSSGKEGLPVALMEAASFGIPLVANDVGGVHEVVTARSGILLPEEAGPLDWAALFDSVKVETLRTVEFRQQVRAFWMEQFNAEHNYRHIGSVLIEGEGTATR